MKKTKFRNRICGSNAVEAARSTAKSFGFGPVAKKGGASVNYSIPESMFQRELRERGK